MITMLILTLSILLQFVAAIMAIRLIPLTGRRTAWSLIAAALLFMALRRCIPLFRVLSGDTTFQPDFNAELIALVISLLIVVGISRIAPIFTERKQAEEKLQRSEEYFRAITENATDIILIVNKKGTITYASPSVDHILGYKQEELIGKSSLDLIVPEDVPRAMHDFGKAISTKGVLIPNIFRIRHKDGSARVLEGVGKNLYENPSVAGFVMNVRDVTDRRKAEEALLESEKRYRGIIENILDVYYRTDKNGNIVMMSPSGASLLGYGSIDEILGQNVAEAFYADPKERNKIISEIQDKGYVRDFEVTLKHSDGTPIPVSTSSRLYFNEEGEVLGVEGVFADIRERKKMESALRESEERYRMLIETTRDLIYTTNSKGFLTYVNPTLEKVLGYMHSELNGESFAQIVSPEDIDRLRDIIRRSMKGDSIPVYEADLIRKDGTKLSVEFNVTTLLDSEGKPVGRYGIGRDITERKRLEKNLIASEKKYRNLVDNTLVGVVPDESGGKNPLCEPGLRGHVRL